MRAVILVSAAAKPGESRIKETARSVAASDSRICVMLGVISENETNGQLMLPIRKQVCLTPI